MEAMEEDRDSSGSDEEAFIDLEDPENVICEEKEEDAPPSDNDSENGEENPGGKIVLRDDALLTFASREKRPLHSISNALAKGLFACGGESDEVYILDQDAKPVTVLTGHGDSITVVAFAPNEETVASASVDSTVKLWSVSSWELLFTLTGLADEVTSLLWHPSSLILVGASLDSQAIMWNVKKGSVAQYFSGHRGAVLCLQWTPDLKKLVTASSDGSVNVFNPKTAVIECTISKDLSPDNAGVTSLCFVSAEQLLIGCEDGTLHVASFQSGRVFQHLQEIHEQSIESIEIDDTRTFFATASCDCMINVWKLNDFSLRSTIRVGEGVTKLRWKGYTIVAACTDGDIRMWDGRANEADPHQVLMGHSLTVQDFGFTGDKLFSVCDDGLMKVFLIE